MEKAFKKPIYVTRPLLPDLKDYNAQLQKVWASQWLTNNGPQHKVFEERIRQYLKAPYSCLFNNGTIAMIIACESLRLSGEVITTPFTFPATPHVLAWNNIQQIFCDIRPDTMTIDADKIEQLITPKTTAILGVHIFGSPCQVDHIEEIANRYGLKVIYDAAHAFGTEINGRGIGTYGDITMFSFHATKLFHTAEGGALTFNDPHLKARIDLLKNFGIKNENEIIMPGINGKMNELEASMGLCLLEIIEEERKKREQILDIYQERLGAIDGISFMKKPESIRRSYQYFTIRINKQQFGRNRNEVMESLKEYNVYTRKYFSPLCSEYACYRQLPSAHPDNLPNAIQVVEEILCLPFYGQLTPSEVHLICDMIEGLRK